mgnify:CR=1 FL=1
MTITYKFYKPDPDFPDVQNIMQLEDGKITWYIPRDEGNIHYQEWVEWAKTNTTEEAD